MPMKFLKLQELSEISELNVLEFFLISKSDVKLSCLHVEKSMQFLKFQN